MKNKKSTERSNELYNYCFNQLLSPDSSQVIRSTLGGQHQEAMIITDTGGLTTGLHHHCPQINQYFVIDQLRQKLLIGEITEEMIVICQGQNISFNGDADAIRSKLFEIRIQQTKDTAENLKVDTLPSRHLHSAPSEISQQP